MGVEISNGTRQTRPVFRPCFPLFCALFPLFCALFLPVAFSSVISMAFPVFGACEAL